MAQNELVRKVQLYLKRIKKDKNFPSYSLEEEGTYRIVGGALGDYGSREPMKDVFEGRFIDAVLYAIKQDDFYAEWCNHGDPSNCNHGYVEKIKVHKHRDDGLLVAIKNSK